MLLWAVFQFVKKFFDLGLNKNFNNENVRNRCVSIEGIAIFLGDRRSDAITKMPKQGESYGKKESTKKSC
jgi:hypothetical protein